MSGAATPSLVSVVIPAYKAEAFIEETIKSVCAQMWRPLEVVVVEDCSPDSTAEVVEGVARRLSTGGFSVRLIRRETNGGVTEALKTGFSAALGDYVCWLSADDLFLDRHKIEKQLAQMRRGAQLVYATSFLQGETADAAVMVEGHWSYRFSGPIDRAFNERRYWRVLGYMFGNPINGSTVMMRRGLMNDYGGFDRFDASGQNLDSDADLWLRLSALGVRFGTVDGPAALYRLHPGQVSQGRTAEWKRDCQIVRTRVLFVFDDLGATARLFNSGWPVLVLALRGRYRTFPEVARAVFEAGTREGVGPIARFLLARLRLRLEREELWDDEAYELIVAAARKAMGSDEFRAFRARLEASDV